jgi:hypothetical protein
MGLQIVKKIESTPRKVLAAVYSRVSTIGHGQDPTMQTRELTEYCERRGWTVFDTYVDIGASGKKDSRPELTYLGRYIDRYGDPDGIAARVGANLLDLLTVTRNSVVLPLPSFSLKVVEDYVGFERKQTEYGGAWAMATFIETTETSDEEKRKELMGKILAYNKEDLEATWTVFVWLRSKVPAERFVSGYIRGLADRRDSAASQLVGGDAEPQGFLPNPDPSVIHSDD